MSEPFFTRVTKYLPKRVLRNFYKIKRLRDRCHSKQEWQEVRAYMKTKRLWYDFLLVQRVHSVARYKYNSAYREKSRVWIKDWYLEHQHRWRTYIKNHRATRVKEVDRLLRGRRIKPRGPEKRSFVVNHAIQRLLQRPISRG